MKRSASPFAILCVCLAGPLRAEDPPPLPPPLQESWLERFSGGHKVGWAHQRIDAHEGGFLTLRESWTPLPFGELRQRVETITDARGRVLRREAELSGPTHRRTSVAAVGSGLEWAVTWGDLPTRGGQLPGGALDLDVVAWLLATGRLPAPPPRAAVRLLDVPGAGIEQCPLLFERGPDGVRVETPREARLLSPEGRLLRLDQRQVLGGGLRPVADQVQAADMERAPPAELTGEALGGLTLLGLREPALGLMLQRPDRAWDVVRTSGPAGVQLGLRHPLGVVVLVQALPLAPPVDEEGRIRVGRMLTHTFSEQRLPFLLANPKPTTWAERPAIQLLVSGQGDEQALRGVAWALTGPKGGVFLLTAAPADHVRDAQGPDSPGPAMHSPLMTTLLEAARAALVLEEVPAAPADAAWKRVELAGTGATVEVPPAWEPAVDGTGFAAPGALLRFGAHRAPPLDGLPRDAALDLLVRRVREGLGGKILEEHFDRPIGGREGRRMVLDGNLPADQGGLATRVVYGFVPEDDGGVTIFMGLAVESPAEQATLERVLSSVQWKR